MASTPWKYYLACNYVNYQFSFLKYKIEIPRNGQCIFPLVEIYVTCESKQGLWTRRRKANSRLLDVSLQRSQNRPDEFSYYSKAAVITNRHKGISSKAQHREKYQGEGGHFLSKRTFCSSCL